MNMVHHNISILWEDVYFEKCSSFFLGFDDLNLSINTDMATVVKAMAQPDSGLEIRDRMWLKITIPNAFIGKATNNNTQRIYR